MNSPGRMHKPELLAHTAGASGDSTTRKLGSGYYIVRDLEPVSAHPPPYFLICQGNKVCGPRGRGHGGWEGELRVDSSGEGTEMWGGGRSALRWSHGPRRACPFCWGLMLRENQPVILVTHLLNGRMRYQIIWGAALVLLNVVILAFIYSF